MIPISEPRDVATDLERAEEIIALIEEARSNADTKWVLVFALIKWIAELRREEQAGYDATIVQYSDALREAWYGSGMSAAIESIAVKFEAASDDARGRARIHSSPHDIACWNTTADNFTTAAAIARTLARPTGDGGGR